MDFYNPFDVIVCEISETVKVLFSVQPVDLTQSSEHSLIA